MPNARRALIACLLAAPGAAVAQELPEASSVVLDSASLIPSQVGIADRERPEYRPIGGRIGNFILLPRGKIEGGYTDNVRARPSGKQGTAELDIRPELLIRSLLGPNKVRFDAYYERMLHSAVSTEDYSQYGATFDATIVSTGQSHLDIDASAEHLIDPRESINNVIQARSPVRHARYVAGIGYTQQFNRLSLMGGFTWRKLDYYAPTSFAGAKISQYFRDFTAIDLRAEARYQLRSGVLALARFDYYRLRYPFGPSSPGYDPLTSRDRDSRRLRAEGGLGFQITEILYGDILAGYQDRKYVRQPDGAAPLRRVRGPTFNVDLLWNPTRSDTVTVKASRGFLESASPIIAGYSAVGGRVQVDHEVLRSVIASIHGGYTHFKPIGGSAPNRNDFEYGASARYSINRRYALTALYRRSGRTSDDVLLPFRENYGGVALRVTF